ncbi:putative repeat protein (TIGR01451 family) [Rhodococcus sp. LBL1]|nr:putative repeat protein (TIGR01451 family) [Rhodococcus sp. LBL1]MDH6686184.1 putative repeat protein (TIGR01451 family) [Rhodococcus sp. LBL2]
MRNFAPIFRILVISVLTSLVALTTVVFGPTSIAQTTAGGLTLVKSASPPVGVKSGDTVTYSFAVTNTGQTPISQVAVNEVLFTGSGSAPQPTCPSGPLEIGRSVTCTATYDVTAADQAACFISNTATATGNDPQGNPVTSAPASARVVTNCANPVTGSAILPALGSPLFGSPLLGSLAAGSLGLGSLGIGSLGLLGALGAWTLSTPYQPPAAMCPNPLFPNVPFLNVPCPPPNAPAPNAPSPGAP